jgi:hypothetical protein
MNDFLDEFRDDKEEQEGLDDFEEEYTEEDIEEDLEDTEEEDTPRYKSPLNIEDLEDVETDPKTLGVVLMCIGGVMVGFGALLTWLAKAA